MSQSFDKRAMNFLSLLPKLLSSGLSEQNASFITHSPRYYLCLKTLGGPAAPHHLPLTVFQPSLPPGLWPRWVFFLKQQEDVGALVENRFAGKHEFGCTSRGSLGVGIPPFRSDMFSGSQWLGGEELNKPKGLGYFSCDTPHRLSGGLERVWRIFGWKTLVVVDHSPG